MNVPEMERNLSGVLQQVTMNKMKNGAFVLVLVRRCLFSLVSLFFFLTPGVSVIFINKHRTCFVVDYKVTSLLLGGN